MVAKTKIELRLLLPTIADERDKCVERLNSVLQAKAGIKAAHLKEDRPGQICIHYDGWTCDAKHQSQWRLVFLNR